jgi:uncharacterized protein (DUF1800 family)
MAQADKALQASLILSRFGLGGGPEGLNGVGSDAMVVLKAEINAGPQGLKSTALKTTPDLMKAYYIYVEARKEMRDKAPPPAQTPGQNPGMMGGDMAGQNMAAPDMKPNGKPAKDPELKDLNPMRDTVMDEVDARFNQSLRDPVIGFNERLVMFWANHFALSADKNQIVRLLVGAYEREAIRPHVFGRFEDMLIAAETHPAMLVYLDNQQSTGPNSRAGQRGAKDTRRGLNENLAREIMELHTLGVGSGYTQADVTAFANVITGWSVGRNQDDDAGRFVFREQAHQPGPQTVLGKTYSDDGQAQGLKVLKDLARHPKTAQHIAYKLARHFLSDTPSPAAVKALSDSYLKHDGDLSAVYLTLIELPEATAPATTKLRTPLEFLTGLVRLTPAKAKPQMVITALKAMGQPLWEPGGPNGFPDTNSAWASPESLSSRLEVANSFAERMADNYDARQLMEQQMGPRLSEDTRRAVAFAETRAQGLTLAFLSPEFMRR